MTAELLARDDLDWLTVRIPGGGAWHDPGDWHFLPRTHHEASVVREVWEQNTYRLRPTDVDHSGNVVDVGACFGAFSLLAAAGGARQVVAVEPHPENLDALHFHLQVNWPVDRDETIEVLPIAAGAGGRVKVVGESVHASTRTDGGQGLDVDCLTLEQLIVGHGLVDRRGAPSVDVLKIDCEGCEFDLLRTATRDVLRACRKIVMEWHGSVDAGALTPEQTIDPREIGWAVTKLLDTHRVEVYGHPGRGGMLYADRY